MGFELQALFLTQTFRFSDSALSESAPLRLRLDPGEKLAGMFNDPKIVRELLNSDTL